MNKLLAKILRRTALACLTVGLSLTNIPRCYAINYLDAAHAPEGGYFLAYPYWYGAQKMKGEDGGTSTPHLALNKYATLLRPAYYGKSYVIHTIIPVGSVSAHNPHGHSEGLGDIVLGAGYFLPIKRLDILPVLNVKFPSGQYNSHRSVNFGDGQFDLRPELLFHKNVGKLSIDTALRYWIRFKNPHASSKPGNEFYAESVAAYELFKGFRLGPTVTFCRGSGGNFEGDSLAEGDVHSDALKLSLGGEVIFNLTKKTHILVDVVPDVYAENAPKGLLVLGRFCYSF